MARRQRIDSATAAVAVVQAAKINPPPHVPLEDCDKPFWENVIAEFARADWTDHQVELAAMLARSMADLNREQQTLRIEGFISVRENGTTVENPRARSVKSLTGDILSLRRSLALHARARSGDSRNDGRRKEMGRELQAGLTDDDLLARPTVQ